MSEIDHAIREMESERPRLRRDIQTHYQSYRGEPSYILEDRANGRYFQIGFPEHQFIQSLNGYITAGQALAQNAATQGENALTEAQAKKVMRWLIDNEMLDTASADQAGRQQDLWRKRDKGRKTQNFVNKVLYIRIPMGCPDRMFARMSPWFGGIFGWFGWVVWIWLMMMAGSTLAQNLERFVSASQNVLIPNNWLGLGAVYVILKVVHEFGHGLATRKFGGAVPEWGVQLLLFVTPLTYADASASWRFSSRWKRIVVSAAGMYVELGIAAICLLAWARTPAGPVNTLLHNAVFAASTVTLLFNANPLMRFDGYYILSDLLNIPNLGGKGQQFLAWISKWLFLGMRDLPLPAPARHHPIAVPLYGLMAFLWRWVIVTGIMIMLSHLFKGAGLALAVAMLGTMLFGFLVKVGRLLAKGEGGNRVKPGRLLLHWALIAAVLGGVFFGIHVSPVGRALAVVQFADQTVVRINCPGEVISVAVEHGQLVNKGDLLLQIENPEAVLEKVELRLDIEASELMASEHLSKGRLAEYNKEQEKLAGMREKLAVVEERLASLQTRAEIPGRIVGRELESLPGKWLSEGTEVMSIVPKSSTKELILSIREQDEKHIPDDPGIRCLLNGLSDEIHAEFAAIEDAASEDVPHPVLAAPGGGPLAVKGTEDPKEKRRRDPSQRNPDLLSSKETTHQLARPRFKARANLDAESSMALYEGQWGYARFSGVEREPFGPWLYARVFNYIKERIDRARSMSN